MTITTIAPCEVCAAPGMFCGLGGVAMAKAPCVRCDQPTAVRSACGVPRLAVCTAPAVRRAVPAVPAAAGPDDAFVGWLRANHDELDRAGVERAETLWRETMRGIAWRGPHVTALRILEGALHYKGIPALPAATPGALNALKDGGVWNARTWLHTPTGGLPELYAHHDLIGPDVNGMYLSAAAIDLPTGDPHLIRDPAPSVLKLTGWVRVAELHNAPWSIASRWTPGMWMPIPLIAYAVERGALVVMPQALAWPSSRRWLDPHVNLMRSARETLIEQAPRDPAAAAVLDAVKQVYTRMFGGLLGSEKYNHGLTMQPAWRAMVNATGQTRMFRGLDKATTGHVIGFHVDAAWIVVRRGEQPAGLVMSTQLGKFKDAGRVPWTPQLAELHAAGEIEAIRKAIKS